MQLAQVGSKSHFEIFFYFAAPPTPQKRPEDGMSTKRSIVPRLMINRLTLRSHFGTLLFLSPRKYRLMTMTDRNVDNVMRIMLRQKYAPEIKNKNPNY